MKKLGLAVLSLVVVLSACTTPGKKTAMGTGIGAVSGAAIGAAAGAIAGDAKKGAIWGAVGGAVIGTAVGNRLDKIAKELEAVAETQRTENAVISKLKSDILFDTGKADLKETAKSNIGQISDILKKYDDAHIIVTGYTDSTGSNETNQRLSNQRAQAVRLQMISGGIAASKLEAIGQGQSNPVSSNTTSEGRSKNRRVELQITVDQAKS
jgi:outer membrane protein OmpA-like peptidoglycan-associated protein